MDFFSKYLSAIKKGAEQSKKRPWWQPRRFFLWVCRQRQAFNALRWVRRYHRGQTSVNKIL